MYVICRGRARRLLAIFETNTKNEGENMDKFQIVKSAKGTSITLSDAQRKSISAYAVKNGMDYETALCATIDLGILAMKKSSSKLIKVPKAVDFDEDED